MVQRDEQTKEVRATVILHGIDLAILRQIEKDNGVSRSAAVRMLIRQYGGVEETDDEPQGVRR